MTKIALKAFRVDRRVFKAGDPIATAGEFSGKHPEKGKKAEEILAARKPDGKPDRTSCVMVFEDESCARKHWVKMKDGKLYEVEISSADIQHRADMRLVDAIGEALSDGAPRTRVRGVRMSTRQYPRKRHWRAQRVRVRPCGHNSFSTSVIWRAL